MDTITVKYYTIEHDIFKSGPKLIIRDGKTSRTFEGGRLILSFISCCAGRRLPFKVRKVEQETPTGGKYYIFEVIE